MKQFFLILSLVICSIGLVYAGPDGVAYSTSVISETLTANTSLNVSSSTILRISRITITSDKDITDAVQTVTLYDNNKGSNMQISTTNARIIYQIDFASTTSNNLNSPRIVQESYSDFLPLIASNGLRIRKSNAGSSVKVNILYR